MIIDAHTHLLPEEVQKNRQSFCRKDEGFRLLYASRRARLVSLDQLLQAMNQEGVDCSVICGFPWKDPGLCREGNDFLLHCFHNHPHRLIPFACLPLNSLRQAQKELDRCLSLGIRGVGELALYDRGLAPSDLRRLTSIGLALSGGEIPLLIHTNEPVGHDYPGKTLKSLQSIYQLLLSLPGVKVILAHWGGGFLFYELMPEVARAARTAFYDTAASPFLYHPKIYSLACKIVGPDRILFGSDFPLIPVSRYFRQIDQVDLPRRVKAKIKGLNAQRLLLRKENLVFHPEIGYKEAPSLSHGERETHG